MPVACCLPKNAGIWARGGGGNWEKPGPVVSGMRSVLSEERKPFHRSRGEEGRPCLTLRVDLDIWELVTPELGDFGSSFWLAKFVSWCFF